MNYLAHLFLTADNEDLLIGQMLGDFLEPGWRQTIPAPVQAGVRLHQQVDALTDSHELFAVSRRRLPAPYRRFSGIAVDMFYDHVLAQRWDDFSPGESLDEFSQRCYATLERRRDDLTLRLRRTLPAIVRYDWLTSYREIEGISRSLRGLSRRLSFDNPLGDAARFLETDYSGFEADFMELFPDLQAFVEANRPDGSRVETESRT